MLPYCGRTFRVKDRVEQHHRRQDRPDAQDPQGLPHPRRCRLLGECSTGRWFCPARIYPYWREAWVRQVEEPDGPQIDSAGPGVRALDAARPQRAVTGP